jgi:hypothetical protein
MSGGRLLHPELENVPSHGDRDPHNVESSLLHKIQLLGFWKLTTFPPEEGNKSNFAKYCVLFRMIDDVQNPETYEFWL